MRIDREFVKQTLSAIGSIIIVSGIWLVCGIALGLIEAVGY